MPCPGMWHWRVLPSARSYVRHHHFRLLIIVFIFILCVIILVVLYGTASSDASEHEDDHLQYGVVIDLGSSGSRVFVYTWPPHSGQKGTLLDIKQMRDSRSRPVVLKIEPGISSFASHPSAAGEYVRPLLEYASRQIPSSKHHESPLYIMATAGLRMLASSEQDAILNVLKKDVSSNFNFLFAESHAEMISGKEEAVYTWVAINYALNNFAHDALDHLHSTHKQKSSVGVIDMGGASLQIAYEVSMDPSTDKVSPSDLKEFNLGCSVTDTDHSYRVFVSTFLGFGGNSARWRHDEMLAGVNQSGTVRDPCRPLDMPDKGETNTTRYTHYLGTGDFNTCHSRLVQLLHPSGGIPCRRPLCSLDGTALPAARFPSSTFYGLSELFYSTDDILGLAGHYNYREFTSAATEFCATPWQRLKMNFKHGIYPRASWHRLKYQCFKSAWVAALLHEGLGLPKTSTKLTNTQLVNGAHVQWTLGAILYKTRYLPLREIEKHYHMDWKQHSASSSHYKAIFIFIIMLCAAITVIIRCRLFGSRRKPIPRVPTMSYFMTDVGQCEEGILIADTSPRFY